MKQLQVFILLFAVVIAFSVKALVKEFGIDLPPQAKQISPHRFLSAQTYENTKRYFIKWAQKTKLLRQVNDEINLPHVRTISFLHLENKSPLHAINIYLNVQTGLTEISFIDSD